MVTAPTGELCRILSIHAGGIRTSGLSSTPAIVQGENRRQPASSRGIHALEQLGVDVMIVGRGGGSTEDPWPLMKMPWLQAVFDCSVPIISAVGHETDKTIIDFVSDLRAPTPSAAAELAVYDVRQLEAVLDSCKGDLTRRIS